MCNIFCHVLLRKNAQLNTEASSLDPQEEV
jgi:hypothetical protein